MIDIKEKASALTEGAKNRRNDDRNERVARDVERLKAENKALKDEIDRDRGRLSELLETLEKKDHPTTKPHRIRQFITLTSAVAGAYVMGARAGRERFEQIRDWARNRGSQWTSASQPWSEGTPEPVEMDGSPERI